MAFYNCDEPRQTQIDIEGITRLGRKGSVTVLTSASLDDVNTIEEPNGIVPVEKEISIQGPSLDCTFPANSLTVFRVNVER